MPFSRLILKKIHFNRLLNRQNNALYLHSYERRRRMKHIRNLHHCPYRPRKSTLADRLLDFTGAVQNERNKINCSTTWTWARARDYHKVARYSNGYIHEETYVLNLIDTPGHVDFSYEVSRSIAACEGALLIVDAAQSIQAQTISTSIWLWKTTWKLSRY